MTRPLLFILFFVAIGSRAFAQTAVVNPIRPTQHDLVVLNYPISAQSALDGSEAIYARITTYLMDGAVTKSHVLLTGDQRNVGATLNLLPQAASVKVEFYTLNKEDDKAVQTRLVYLDGGQQPVRSAYLDAMFTDKPSVPFQQEIAAYPNNYLAHARYFNVLAMVSDPDTAGKTIRYWLPILTNVPIKTAGLLCALCVGYAKTGRLAEGKSYLFDLFNQFPTAAETAFAFSIYNYEYYKTSGKEVEADVRQVLKRLFVDYPDGALARSENVFRYLQQETDLPTTVFERVAAPLYADDRVPYHAFASLPELYVLRKERLDSARRLLQQGILRFQDGTINHQYRLSGSHYQLYVPYLLLTLARIDLLEQAHQQAIDHASAGLALLTGSNAEGNFRPLLLQVRASAYQRLGNLNLALDDYKQLYKAGQTTALDSMRRLMSRCQVKQKTVEELVASLTTGAAVSIKPQLPNFTGTDLNGQRVSLRDFANKVVVINVWGIGCGPCVAEMPRLNSLVKQFAHRSDVVFLGITADAAPALKRFVKNHPFAYRLLNNVGHLTDVFNTNVLPVHLVVGKQGDIISRSIGAREDIDTYLSQLIQQQLK